MTKEFFSGGSLSPPLKAIASREQLGSVATVGRSRGRGGVSNFFRGENTDDNKFAEDIKAPYPSPQGEGKGYG